jgi:hypothetical protein
MDAMSEKDLGNRDLRSILEGLQAPAESPIVRARKMVELEVPPARRGPGWDRHWRELEAYLESPADWPCQENDPPESELPENEPDA